MNRSFSLLRWFLLSNRKILLLPCFYRYATPSLFHSPLVPIYLFSSIFPYGSSREFAGEWNGHQRNVDKWRLTEKDVREGIVKTTEKLRLADSEKYWYWRQGCTRVLRGWWRNWDGLRTNSQKRKYWGLEFVGMGIPSFPNLWEITRRRREMRKGACTEYDGIELEEDGPGMRRWKGWIEGTRRIFGNACCYDDHPGLNGRR